MVKKIVAEEMPVDSIPPKLESIEVAVKKSKGALLIGGGGGGDVVQTVPMMNFLQTLGLKNIVLANTSINWWKYLPGKIAAGGGDVYSVNQLTSAKILGKNVAQVSGKTVLKSGPGKGHSPHEAVIAGLFDVPAFTIGIQDGTQGIVEGLKIIVKKYDLDMVMAIDMGADSFYSGKEHTIASPLIDSIVTAAILQLGIPAYFVLAGYGCDAELSIAQLNKNVGEVMRCGGFLGAHGLTPEDLKCMERIFKDNTITLEKWGYLAARGNIGSGYTKEYYSFESTPLTAMLLFFDPSVIVNHLNPLPNLVSKTTSLKQTEDIFLKIGLVPETRRPMFVPNMLDQ